MKSKDKKELHGKSLKELNNMVSEAKNKLSEMLMDKQQNKLKNPSSISLQRKDIAQILTISRAKELSEVKGKK